MPESREIHSPANRRYPRYECKFPTSIDIILPELTFSPTNVAAMCLDLSRTGCRLTTSSVSHDYYLLLVKELRHAKLEVDLLEGRVLRLRGRLVWVDFSRNETSLGLLFTGISPSELEVLDDLLTSLEAAGMIHLAACPRPVLDMAELDLE